MTRWMIGLILTTWQAWIVLLVFLLSACAPAATGLPPTAAPDDTILSTLQSPSITGVPSDGFSDIPAEARAATRQGDPRPPAYWMVWNRCAPENRAEWADANGGRAAGWTLMDDLIASPGIQLGGYAVQSCEAGLALLQARTVLGEETDDPVYTLASALLTAELNLGVGAETCAMAEEAVVGGHLVLSTLGFTGEGFYELSGEIADALPRLVALLEGYNRGELCR